MSRENMEVVHAGYDALNRDDIDGWLALTHAHAELHELAEIPDTAVYRGREGLRRWADATRQLVSEWRWAPEEFLHVGDEVIVVRTRLTAKAASSGVPIDQIVVHVIEFEAGKVVAYRGFLDPERALQAVGLSE